MVFSKFSELLSSTANLFSAPKASRLSYKVPPVTGSPHRYAFSSAEKKNTLRLSSSLQDLSTYCRLDLEQGDLSGRVEKTSISPYLLQKENGVSSFSKEKVSSGISSKRNKCLHVICILLCLLLVTCLSFALQFFYSNWSIGASKFYVVLDCGSTGTRVYVYEAAINHGKTFNLPVLLKSLPQSFEGKSDSKSGRAYNRMETEPGFDKLVHNISGLRGAIEPLVEWAKKQIPEKSHKTTSLFLYATAGVRRLPSSDSEWLLSNALTILKDSPFSCKKEWVKIISGMEEAYYGWIALNYHTGVLGSIPKKETFGALDLGGSSLQVTYEGKQGENDETSLNLSIGHVNHHLSAYSLAGYGLNDAFDKTVAHLLKKLSRISNTDLGIGEVEIEHPCLQSGYKEQYTCQHCSSHAKAGVQIQLTGVPNWEKCSALAKVAVNLSEWSDHSLKTDCELHPCALSENTPRPVGQFYAMSGFYVVYRFFNLTPDADLDDVLEKRREFCEMTWDVARKNVVPQPFIVQYCFRAPYVVLLLRDGLHISDSDVIIGSGSISWTLGAALFEAGKAFPYGGYYRGYDMFWAEINPFVVVLAVFVSLVFIFFLCTLPCTGESWVPKFLRGPWMNIFRHNSIASTSVLNVPGPFRFRRWSRPIDIGDGRAKMPLSPTIAGAQQSPFGIQFAETSLYSSSSSVAHSYSSDSLGQMQFGNSNLGSLLTPNRSQMHLQSRRSQSREDLVSSIAEAHFVKI